jgi:hypothetical protein
MFSCGACVSGPVPERPGDEAPPEPGGHASPFPFLYFSDTQADPEAGSYAGFGELLAAVVSREGKPDLAIFGGDTVNDGGDAEDWAAFREAAAGPLDGVATAAVPGNHDSHALLAGQFDYPARAPAGQGEGFF